MASHSNEEETNNELRTLLDEQNLHPFLELISNLTSSENEKRTRCEKIFELVQDETVRFHGQTTFTRVEESNKSTG